MVNVEKKASPGPERPTTTVNADDGQPSELFDLASDPDEATNLVDHPSTAEPIEALGATLTATVGNHDSEA